MNKNVQNRLSLLPDEPGVYLMKDASGEIIYIGKAKVLKNRVRSYFSNKNTDHRAAQLMVPFIVDIDWILTGSEVDALLLEAELVQKHQPKYNVRLKDDKHFPYLKLTVNEKFPRIEVVRKIRNDGSTYFGPYLNAKAMRRVLNAIPNIFRIRECTLKFPLKEPITPCLSYHIKRCDGPCANYCTEAEYGDQVAKLIPFLQGKSREVIQKLNEEMKTAVDNLYFEQAARLRDQIKDIESLNTPQMIDLRNEEGHHDFVSWARKGDLFTAVVLEYRSGKMTERRHYHYKLPLEEEDEAPLEKLLIDHYQNQNYIPPQLYLLKSGPYVEVYVEALTRFRKKKVMVDVPQRGDKLKVLELSLRNAEMLVMEQVAKEAKAKAIDESVDLLQRELKLKRPPRYIEGFDISHLGGTGTVASQVVFRNGKASKQEYRKYKVKTVEGIDDFASMREVLGRRLRRLKEENLELPDLILIDGGKGQVEAAYAQLEASGLDIEMIGLAKRIEEVFFPRNSKPHMIPYRSPALKLLQRVRNESHRFAITFQRKQREKTLISLAWLEELEGVGKVTAAKVRKKYQTLFGLQKADEEELIALVGKKASAAILLKLREFES